MLYDPKWEPQTKVAPLSLGGLITWLEKQSPDRQYDLGDPFRCVLARYIGEATGTFYCSGTDEYQILGTHQYVIHDKPRTYGAVLKRAVALTKGQRT